MKRIRYHRRYKSKRNKNIKKTGVNLLAIVVIIGLAVSCGFMTAKYIIYPIVLGQEASFGVIPQRILGEGIGGDKESGDNEDGDNPGADTDKMSVKEGVGAEGGQNGNNNEDSQDDGENEDMGQIENDGESQNADSSRSGYCIQFGSFSEKESAEKLIAELAACGISGEIVEREGAYKVIGRLFATKEEAAAEKSAMEYEQKVKYKDAFITSI